jgi:signal transduction histidine kinase
MSLGSRGRKSRGALVVAPLRMRYVCGRAIHSSRRVAVWEGARGMAETRSPHVSQDARHADVELAETRRILAAYERIGATALATAGLGEVLDTHAREIVAAGVFRSLMFALVDESSGHVEVQTAWATSPDGEVWKCPPHPARIRYARDDVNITAEVARTGKTEVVTGWDDRLDARFDRKDAYDPCKVAYFIPVKRGIQVVAVMATASDVADRELTLARIDAMAPLLTQVAVAVDHARLFQELTSSHETLRAAIEGARCVVWRADVERHGAELDWDMEPMDEEAAQRLLPVHIGEGETWLDGAYRARDSAHGVSMDQMAQETLESGGTHYTHEFPGIDRDGHRRWIKEDVFAHARGDDRWWVTGVLTDVTARREREDEVRTQNEQLEERVRKRTIELDQANADLRRELAEHTRTAGELRRIEGERAALLHRVLSVQDEERARIARELHDQTGQALGSLLVGLRVLENATSLEDVHARLHTLRQATKEALEQVRTLSFELRPAPVEHFGVAAALRRDVATLAEQLGVRADFYADRRDGYDLAEEVEGALYRVVHAALANVVRHAKASNISVVLRHRGGRLHALIEDDGEGFDVDAVVSGPVEGRFGLLAMEERLRPVGGHLSVESTPGSGTTTYVDVPVASDRGFGWRETQSEGTP